MSLAENLERLSNICGVAGREGEVRDLMIDLLKPYVDEVKIDKLENVIAIKKGKSDHPRVMLAAHMDEIGLMVKHISKEGFLKFAKLGGIDDRVLLAQKVKIYCDNRVLSGVIGAKPPHIQKEEERKKVITYDNLFIDIGAKDREDAKRMGVKIGTPASFDVEYEKIGNNVAMGKAFDDRIGCATMVETMRRLENIDCTVFAVGTVQEEVGLRGATTAAFGVEPDIGIALDVTIAGDVPGVREFDTSVKMGKGPTLTISDSGLITHPKVLNLFMRTAEEFKIDFQLETGLLGSTDAARISLSREGVPSGTISIPARYIHSPAGLISLTDAENSAKLAVESIKKVGDEF